MVWSPVQMVWGARECTRSTLGRQRCFFAAVSRCTCCPQVLAADWKPDEEAHGISVIIILARRVYLYRGFFMKLMQAVSKFVCILVIGGPWACSPLPPTLLLARSQSARFTHRWWDDICKKEAQLSPMETEVSALFRTDLNDCIALLNFTSQSVRSSAGNECGDSDFIVIRQFQNQAWPYSLCHSCGLMTVIVMTSQYPSYQRIFQARECPWHRQGSIQKKNDSQHGLFDLTSGGRHFWKIKHDCRTYRRLKKQRRSTVSPSASLECNFLLQPSEDSLCRGSRRLDALRLGFS